jgi:nucleoside-diphosphate-sugar epimerase
MRLLIAGGGGYIGSALIPKLLERGYDVDVVDLFWFGNHLPQDVKIVHRDLFHLHVSDLEGYDQVIFLAGLSNDPMAEFSPARNFIFNAAAPAYLCYIAKQAGVRRYIYASSCSVYGYTENELFDEDRPTICASAYGISKLQGERAVTQLADGGFSVIALRKGTVCGYSPRMRFDLIVNTMFKSAMKDGVIRVNNPAIWRPILSIEDATAAYIRAIEASESLSGIFNIASGNHTVGETADQVTQALEHELGTRPVLEIQQIKDIRNYKVCTQRAATVLSFHPRHSVHSIVRNLIENRGRCCDWENPNYYNIEVFRRLEDDRRPAGGVTAGTTP